MRACSRSRRVVAHAVALGTVALPGAAYAQNLCGPGQMVVDAVGHCCSPGQSWDAAAGQCATAPAPVTTAAPIPSAAPTSVTVTTVQTTPIGPVAPGTIPQSPQVTNLIVQHAPLGDPTAPVPVTFVPEQPGDMETLQIQPVVGPAVTCQLPCVVNLAPGYVTISGNGQRSFQTAFNVPPLSPVTLQVNHLKSQAVGYFVGTLLTVGGVAAGIWATLSIINGAGSCGTGARTPIEEAAQNACNSSQDTGVIVGSLVLPLGITGLVTGLILLATSANRGNHPLAVMDPGDISNRPITGSAGIRFAGVEPAAVPGGGGILRAAFTF